MKNFAKLLLLLLWIDIYGIDNNNINYNDKRNDTFKENNKNINFGINGSVFENVGSKNFAEIIKMKRKTSGNFWLFLCLFLAAIIVSILYLCWDIIHKNRVSSKGIKKKNK